MTSLEFILLQLACKCLHLYHWQSFHSVIFLDPILLPSLPPDLAEFTKPGLERPLSTANDDQGVTQDRLEVIWKISLEELQV